MARQLADDDYYALEAYVRDVISRLYQGACGPDEARADLMHPLSAWDSGNTQEFGPYMRIMMEKWKSRA